MTMQTATIIALTMENEMTTKAQKSKKVSKRERAKLKAAKSAAKTGVQGAGELFAYHNAKVLNRVTRKPSALTYATATTTTI